MCPEANQADRLGPATWAEIIAALRQPAAYPHAPDAVHVIETHISWVFLAGDRVFKLKRPMDYGFVDFTTAEARWRACRDEVRLNRRLTSGVYLGVAPVIRTPFGIRMGELHAAPQSYTPPEGTEVLEWATVMRRLPADRMLDVLIERGRQPLDLAQRLSAHLIPFHRHAAAPCPGGAAQLAGQQAQVITENLDQLAPFAGRLLDPGHLALVTRAMRAFLAANERNFLDRAERGWIREGHGDLRCEHICIECDDTLQIFDCVEFSQALRCADIAMDLAFLLLDLERLGAPRIALDIVDEYRRAGVVLPAGLLGFCKAHRALVRVKINCLTVQNAGDDFSATAVTDLLSEAARYLDHATTAIFEAGPALIVMSGLSGTGKTTVASALQRALDATHLMTDAIRRDLFGEPERSAAGQPAQWQAGRYTPANAEKVYERMWELAATALAAGRPVILDGTFLEPARRITAANLAQAAGVPCLIVETTCSEATALRRITARQEGGATLSEADTTIYRAQRERYAQAPPVVPSGAIAVEVSTEREGIFWIGAVLRALADRGVLRVVPWDAPAPPDDRSSRRALA